MKRSIIALLSLPFCMISCNDTEVFEQEMYKNVVALISSSYHNNFEEVVPLNGEEVAGYISASVGGSYAPTKDLSLNLIEENTPFNRYNWSLYDADSSRYARLLPSDKYEIPDYKLVIKAGERTGRTLIKLRPDGLSPDSTYFISLVAADAEGLELNPTKKNILYKVSIYNQYASQSANSFYSMTGLLNGAITAASKQLFPISSNSVRVIAGTESFVSDEENIANSAILLEVDAENKVKIKPYKNIQVEQIDGNSRFPNTFHVEESFGRKFNVFLLSYRYILNNEIREMQEELRMEIRK
jgi:hypothetical protein